jgi:isopentenyldiphosphate isomerase
LADKFDELLEVKTSEGEATGIAKPRQLVHECGDYHSVVHVWIIEHTTGKILLQKRSKNKKANPGKYDISSAGHILFGEDSLESAQKEVAEELGIWINDLNRFEKLFSYLQQFTLHNGTYIENEWVDVYLLDLDRLNINELNLQKEEVDGIALVHYKQLEKMMRNGDERIVPVYNSDALKLFDVLNSRYSSTDKPENYEDLSLLS